MEQSKFIRTHGEHKMYAAQQGQEIEKCDFLRTRYIDGPLCINTDLFTVGYSVPQEKESLGSAWQAEELRLTRREFVFIVMLRLVCSIHLFQN